MAEALNDVSMQNAAECDTCENLAEHLCKTCHDKLCIRCKDIHTKSKSSFDHKIVQLTFESLSLLSETPSVQECRSHPGFRANVCCKDCEIPVCEKCLIGEHNGHKLTSTEELFREKKKKLEEKFLFVESELPKYEAEMENLNESEKKNAKSREKMQHEIVSHFKEAREKLDEEEKRLLQIAQSQHQVEHNKLQAQKTSVSEYINETQNFMKLFQTEISSQKNAFILYSNTTIPEKFPCFSSQVTLHFIKGTLDKHTLNQISGTISNTAGLMQEMLEIDRCQVGIGEVETLSYQLCDNTYWVFVTGDSSYKKCNRSGEVLHEVKTMAAKMLNKPFCILSDGTVILRKTKTGLAQMKDNIEKEFVDLKNDSPICTFLSEGNTTIAVGIINSEVTEGKILKFNKHAQCVKEMNNTKFFRSIISLAGSTKMAENVNGDFYISNTIVDVFDKTGTFRFSYSGRKSAEYTFDPRGVCTDIMGNVLIADKKNRYIHVLDINGKLQKLYDVSSENEDFNPVTLAIDANHCLCVGCSDGKIRVFKYLG